MTRIAYLVSDYFAPSHTFVRREVAAVREAGLEIVPFSIQRSHGDVRVEAILNRSIWRYPVAVFSAVARQPMRFMSSWLLAIRHRPPGLRGLVWSQFHFVEAMVLAGLLRKNRCTHLHNHFANSAATVGMIAAYFASIPWSFTLHGISETDYPAGMLLREKLERADFVACASYFMRAQAMRNVAFQHWQKMRIVRCGVNIHDLPAQLLSEDIDKGRVRIITVGRLSAEKGYFGLLEVLSNLKGKGHAFSATIVGDGPTDQAIRDKVRDLSLGAHIRFTSALTESETLAEIQTSDIMVLPSLMEGLPVVLIEALAMRKAVVASHVAGIPELISEGLTGLLFTPSDWGDLERQLVKLMLNPKLRVDLGNNGYERVDTEFGSQQAASELVTLFLGNTVDSAG